MATEMKTKKVLTVKDVLAKAEKAKGTGYQHGLRMAQVEVNTVSYVHGLVNAHADVAKAFTVGEDE